MVTVNDLITRLKELPLDMPVYWGYDELPCWVAKKDATIEDFPLIIDSDSWDNSYLYFYDQNAVDIERQRYTKLNNKSLISLLKSRIFK